ncbi:ATP-binding protein [Streptomyces sp. NPDC087908]|uniref:ATP-binding protein n=1 Tax=Streptomyces sp. NPDC087908 TaxID=3365820 RepID=UPI003801204E
MSVWSTVTRQRVGLRIRLAVAFLAVAVMSAGTTATLTYREARNAILRQTQDTAVASFRETVQRLTPTLPLDLQKLRTILRQASQKGRPHSWTVFAEYGSVRVSSAGAPIPKAITPELRRAAHSTARATFQRVDENGFPWLAIAIPVTYRTQGSVLPTELIFYAVMPLSGEEATIDAMILAARNGALPGLAIALVSALLAGRRVLRPVRELREAARDLGQGALQTRISIRGSDELADLATTFNTSAEQLQRSVDELQEAEARARRFASDVSHELRTPLAGMVAVTEMLDEDADHLDPDTAAAVRLISAETTKLAVLVEDLMEMSRFDAGAAELNADEVDVAEVIRKSLSLRQWTAEDIVTDLPHGIRARLDPRRFDVILANLVGNALHHGATPVTVRLRSAVRPGGEQWLVTQVLDNGPGIPRDNLPFVFERFYKVNPARTRSMGSGLGLAITLENARLHGGAVRAENLGSGGAVFTLEIPIASEGKKP